MTVADGAKREGATLPVRPSWLPPDGELRAFLGDSAVYPFYRLRLVEYIARLLPSRGPCRVLDVGAGDGSLGTVFERYRPQTSLIGVEVSLRAKTRSGFRVVRFDGRALPFADQSFDVALISNVLHHAKDPDGLMADVRRVTRSRAIVKDHVARGPLDHLKLGALDVMGNLRFGAQIEASYLSMERWERLFGSLPRTRVAAFHGLRFRRGLMEWVFANGLEVMFALDFDATA
jgi:SAM-dependent methyltransferase